MSTHNSLIPDTYSPLHSLFYPRGVVVVGSTSEGKLGYELIRQILNGGYQDVFAVNPRAQGVGSTVPGYDAVAKIEHPVDLAVIVSPTPTVPAVLEDCGRAGVKAAVIITAGFSEVGNSAGEVEIKRVAEKYGIRFVGPNCAGILNTRHRLCPTLETPPPAGGVALIAQSGAVGGVVLAWAKEFGLGVSKFVSYGNGADLNEIELLPYLAGDPETKVVGLYIESVGSVGDRLGSVRDRRPTGGELGSVRDHRPTGGELGSVGDHRPTGGGLGSVGDRRPTVGGRPTGGEPLGLAGRAFMQAVWECTRHKPLVVIKAGRTQSGQRATLSHTGSMAGADAVYDAALRQCGAIRVHTIEEMFDLCKGFLYVPRLKGRRVAIVTNSGGPGVLAADRAEEVGLEVAEPSPAVKEKLSQFLPAHCALKNPIDLTVEGTGDEYRKTLLAALQEYDVALALNVATPYLDSVPLARGVCDAARQSGKPIVASFLPGRIVAESIPHLQERGVPNFATGERAVTALARVADYGERREARVEGQPLSARPGPQEQKRLPGDGQTRGHGQATPLLEREAMAWLRENGIPVLDSRFAATQAEAIQGCREIGYPVVMKVVSPEILHKSDYGGVILDVQDDEAARAAFEALQRAASGKDLRGVVIYPLVREAQEVLLGLSRDPQFGPVVAFGLGGIYTEVWRDVSLRVAPVDRAEAEAMIRETRSFPLLQGVRGQAPRDLDALADVLVNFSRLPLRYPDIDEIDLNPVFLFSRGLVVGDVRVIGRQ